MMKIILFITALPVFFSSCSTSCNEKLKKLYVKNQRALIQAREVNGFTLTMSFMPSRLLPQSDGAAVADSTEFYYFKLQVQCPPTTVSNDAARLNYGIDSLFYGTDSLLSLPSLVEPVVTGRQQFYEYLLVFPKGAFDKQSQLRVHFLDRLFTNTRLSFDFDRSIIEEIETLPCYAKKA
jgi:hypothetical protein